MHLGAWGSYFETASGRIESGKERRFMILGDGRNTAFLECIAVSAYMKCYKFLRRIVLF